MVVINYIILSLFMLIHLLFRTMNYICCWNFIDSTTTTNANDYSYNYNEQEASYNYTNDRYNWWSSRRDREFIREEVTFIVTWVIMKTSVLGLIIRILSWTVTLHVATSFRTLLGNTVFILHIKLLQYGLLYHNVN